MCALLSLTATSHCLQEKKKTGKAAAGKKEDVKAEAKEEVQKEAPQSKKAEGKKAEGKKAEAAIVLPLPMDKDGNPIDTET